MALYIVGDIQGCLDELQALLHKVNFNTSQDCLYLAGDLVARGPKSLETLRFIKGLGDSANFVLGNHDLHLLAIHAKIKKCKPQDRLKNLLEAPDLDDLMNWLAQHPLILELPNSSGYLSHAGFNPQWTIQQALKSADFVRRKLSGPKRKHWLKIMYGERPNSWFKVKTDEELFRFTVNSLTRMRYCFEDGSLDFDCKAQPQTAPNNLLPWFELCENKAFPAWVFGHWAALMGKNTQDNIYALDTGCVWGNHLTMLRWDDKKLFTENAINQ
jgi:bis(5'-nucleosyl)-tetraphosphatase (symmetrical)